MNEMPQPVNLLPKELEALKALQDEGEALQRVMQTWQNQAEVKMRKLQQRGSKVYAEIAQRAGVDMKRVNWAPDFSRGALVPVRVNLVTDPSEV